MPNHNDWTDDQVAKLQELAVAGAPASAIATELGYSRISVLGKAVALGIKVLKRSPEEEAERREFVKARERLRMRERRQRLGTQSKGPSTAKTPVALASRPPVITKRPHISREMTKSQLRAELAQAVRNTAAMPVE